jgi:hypothetical protein
LRTAECAPSAPITQAKRSRPSPPRPARATVGSVRGQFEARQLGALLHRDPSLAEGVEEDTLGPVLRQGEEEVEAMGDLRQIQRRRQMPLRHDPHPLHAHARPDQPLGHARRFEQVEGARVDRDGAALGCRLRVAIDDANRLPAAVELDGGREPDRPGTDDQDLVLGHGGRSRSRRVRSWATRPVQSNACIPARAVDEPLPRP